jgi:hypothetical protein
MKFNYSFILAACVAGLTACENKIHTPNTGTPPAPAASSAPSAPSTPSGPSAKKSSKKNTPPKKSDKSTEGDTSDESDTSTPPSVPDARIVYKTLGNSVHAADYSGQAIPEFTPIENVELFRASPRFIAYTSNGEGGTTKDKFFLAENNGTPSKITPVKPNNIINMNVTDSYLTFFLRPNPTDRGSPKAFRFRLFDLSAPLFQVPLSGTDGQISGKVMTKVYLKKLSLWDLTKINGLNISPFPFATISNVKQHRINSQFIASQDATSKAVKLSDFTGADVASFAPIANVDKFELSETYIAYTLNGSTDLNIADLTGTVQGAPIPEVKSFRISDTHLVYISMSDELHLVDLATGMPVDGFTPIPGVSEAYVF